MGKKIPYLLNVSPSYQDKTMAVYYKIPINQYMKYQMFRGSPFYKIAWKFKQHDKWNQWKEMVDKAIKSAEGAAKSQYDPQLKEKYKQEEFFEKLKKLIEKPQRQRRRAEARKRQEEEFRKYQENYRKQQQKKKESPFIDPEDNCMAMLCAYGITTKMQFLKWMRDYHPDKCRASPEECKKREEIFKKVYPKLVKCMKAGVFCKKR